MTEKEEKVLEVKNLHVHLFISKHMLGRSKPSVMFRLI